MVLLNRGAEYWEDELEKMETMGENSFLETRVKEILSETVARVVRSVRERRRKRLLKKGIVLKDGDELGDDDDDDEEGDWLTAYRMSMERMYGEHAGELHDDDDDDDEEGSEEEKMRRDCFPRFMGRHLWATIMSLPIGRNLTSLIIDGTGVSTAYMEEILERFSGRLKGISVRNCPNIEISLWGNWILRQMYLHRPVALQWLRVWDYVFPSFFSHSPNK